MVSEEKKFRAELIKLGGVAFLAPVGKIFLNPFITFNENGTLMFIVSLLYSLFLAYLGLVFIIRSYDIISSERKDL